MAKKVKRGGAKFKAAYTAYKAQNRVEKNAIRRLEKHLKAYPNDAQCAAQLEKIKKEGRPYKRNNVKKSHTWSPREIFLAELCNIRHQTPIIKRAATVPEWKKTLQALRSS